jgi:hypothetical protein
VQHDSLERQLTLALGGGTSPEFEFAQTMRVFPPAKHDALELEELLSAEEREVRDRVRKFAVRNPQLLLLFLQGCNVVEDCKRGRQVGSSLLPSV